MRAVKTSKIHALLLAVVLSLLGGMNAVHAEVKQAGTTYYSVSATGGKLIRFNYTFYFNDGNSNTGFGTGVLSIKTTGPVTIGQNFVTFTIGQILSWVPSPSSSYPISTWPGTSVNSAPRVGQEISFNSSTGGICIQDL